MLFRRSDDLYFAVLDSAMETNTTDTYHPPRYRWGIDMSTDLVFADYADGGPHPTGIFYEFTIEEKS